MLMLIGCLDQGRHQVKPEMSSTDSQPRSSGSSLREGVVSLADIKDVDSALSDEDGDFMAQGWFGNPPVLFESGRNKEQES